MAWPCPSESVGPPWTATATASRGAGVAGSVELLAPSASLELTVQAPQVPQGSLLSLQVTVRNTGGAPGTGWLNLTLPGGFIYRGDNGTFPAAAAGAGISWTLPTLAPGAVISLAIVLQVPVEAGYQSLRLTMDLTDGRGSPPVEILNNSITVEVIAPGPLADALGLWWWLVAAAAVGTAVAAFVLWPRGKIEEIFLVRYSGTLMAHVSRTLTPEKDRDILSSMLTAVQDFIREAFARSKEGELQHMDFGLHSIFIQRGVYGYLAVVVKGRAPRGLTKKMKATITSVEGKLGSVIQEWTGEVEAMVGAYDILHGGLLRGLLRRH